MHELLFNFNYLSFHPFPIPIYLIDFDSPSPGNDNVLLKWFIHAAKSEMIESIIILGINNRDGFDLIQDIPVMLSELYNKAIKNLQVFSLFGLDGLIVKMGYVVRRMLHLCVDLWIFERICLVHGLYRLVFILFAILFLLGLISQQKFLLSLDIDNRKL